MIECSQNKKDTIQDRTIYEDAFIFAPNLKSMGLMTTEVLIIMNPFKTLKSFVKDPTY